MFLGPLIGFMLLATLAADLFVQPRASRVGRRMRSPQGMWLAMLVTLAIFSLALVLFGNPVLAALFAAGLSMVLTLVSNTKARVLGEPLIFSDLVLLRDVFRHPRFYLTALKPSHSILLALGFIGLFVVLVLESVSAAEPRAAGLGLLVLMLTLLAITLRLGPWYRLAPRPEILTDVAAHGLIASTLLYWRRWSTTQAASTSPAGLPTVGNTTLLVAVQCESFADPVELFKDPSLELPGLKFAQQVAWRKGRLFVSGFGAYTMRTEYGVLFGKSEDELGFRQYDPYLTALEDQGSALPSLFSRHGWHSTFVHPHDLRFYRRDRVMPAAGFDELVGPEAFHRPADGSYISDDAIANVVMERARQASSPSLIHAVTIENHGPWPLDQTRSQTQVSSAYMRLVRKGDAMLARLMTEISQLRRPALLLFYGDHRPSIPGVVVPGGDRHTPYVLVRFGADGQPIVGSDDNCDLTPAGLHRAVLDAVRA